MVITDYKNREVKFQIKGHETPDTSVDDYQVQFDGGGLVELRAAGQLKVHLINDPEGSVFTIVTDKINEPLPYLIDSVIKDVGNVADADVLILT